MEVLPDSQVQSRETILTSQEGTTQATEDTTQSHVLYSILCRDEISLRSKQYSLPENSFENAEHEGPGAQRRHIVIEVVVEAIGAGSASDWQSDATFARSQEEGKKPSRHDPDNDPGSSSDPPLAKARDAAIEEGRKEIAVEYTEDKGRFESGFTSYARLWQLFRPGATVYARVGGKLAAYVFTYGLEKSEYEKLTGSTHCWVASCWALRYNGRRIVRSPSTFTIHSFFGYKEILSLPTFPAIYQDRLDGRRTKAQLTELGRKYYKIVRESPAHKRYEGLCWDLEGAKNFRMTARWQNRKPDSEYKGEIVIDHRKKKVHRKDEGLSDHEGDEGIEGTGVGDTEDSSEGNAPSANFNSFSPRRVIGFTLAQRQNMEFDIDLIKPIEWPPRDKDPMNALILETSDKKLLQALTRKHARGERSWTADYTEGNGEGNIFLFHCPPGTGKTFTVECIARYTRRPLLRLTVADIGTNEGIVEQILLEWFQRGTDWGAIILIDEADVFLEKRQVKDLQRNSLVSAFLSCMEYYAGMLFLTTNRIGHIDDAILSRISVTLTYKILDIGKQKRIWDGFLEKLANGRKDIILTDRAKKFTERLDQDPTLKDLPWNGREIRNALQIVIALATHDAEEAAEETGTMGKIVVEHYHFQVVVDRRKEFVDYRTSIHRRDEEARAVADGARAKST